MNKIEIIKKLNLLEADILKGAYTEDWDGDDQESGKPIIRKVYIGLDEDEIKSLLVKISEIIQLMKEENND